MRHKPTIGWFLLCLLCICFPSTAIAETTPTISAEAAIIMDYQTGEIVYSKNPFEPRPPASLTKIMTAFLVLETQSDLSKIATVSSKAANTEESSIHLIEGEQINLENLLYGALLKSGNDACVSLAETVAFDEEDFVWRMNLMAQFVGCVNTQFTNTNGLPDEEHYSCAYDLAIMTRHALKNDRFKTIVGTPYATVQWENGKRIQIKNTNRLLQFYPGAIGVKTGTTNAAGQCLVAAANRNERCLIVVVLKSQNRFLDAANLLDYGYKQLS